KGMCNIHSGATWSGQSNSTVRTFECAQIIGNDAAALAGTEEDMVKKAMGVSQGVKREGKAKTEEDRGGRGEKGEFEREW
ncbi:IgaA/UmoB family intracellular growth attenuator, partial [Salmonella enterica]|uniref:IgaA/UmoB family intracellular growth attenuator n=1 Tax=Salmonella enterica TaxID=28901 RepID=UPI00398C2A2B